MENEKGLVGKRVNLDTLAKEIDKNNHKLKVCDFMNIFYMVMSELEQHHPAVKETMDLLGKEGYDQFVCAVVFSLCTRLAQITMTEEAFMKMVDRICVETVEIEMPDSEKKDMN